MPWRVFPWDPKAAAGQPYSPSYVYPHQGSGRFDLKETAVLYLAETAEHAVAEKLQRFRGQKLAAYDLTESGHKLALVECVPPAPVLEKIADLCDPQVLLKHALRPDLLASTQKTRTQGAAKELYDSGYAGLRWWSALSGDWHTVVLFLDRAANLEYRSPTPLSLNHPNVIDAAAAIGVRTASGS
jgi:RES domain-containing protein